MKKKAKNERLPASNIEAVQLIRKKQIKEIYARQKAGARLQSYDYAFLREVIKEETELKTASERRVRTQDSIEKSLPSAKLQAFHRLCELVGSKREDVALHSCLAIKNWAKDEEPPQEEYEIVDADPENEPTIDKLEEERREKLREKKVTPITNAKAKANAGSAWSCHVQAS